MMPKDGIETLRGFDAIFLGAVGWPAKVPDSVSLHGLLLPIRKAFAQYANASARTACCRASRARSALQTSTSSACARTPRASIPAPVAACMSAPLTRWPIETAIFTRTGVERILRFGFEQARRRRGRLASVTKSNAQKHTMVFWDEMTEALAAEYPEVEVTRYHIDAMCARMVMAPESLDVVVASNLFGDILTDLGAAIQGGLGFAASANVNPDRTAPSMFEPVHGSAPDIAHLGIANPIAAIWSAAMMLEHLGEVEAAARVMAALEATTARGVGVTPGKDRTDTITEAVLTAL
jgi:tartrate dehydrogenase/decarboxylase / D-malate dehydrogenase